MLGEPPVPQRMISRGPGFESSLGHASTLKLLGRVCRPFGSYNARGISLRSCARRILGLHTQKNDFSLVLEKGYKKYDSNLT